MRTPTSRVALPPAARLAVGRLCGDPRDQALVHGPEDDRPQLKRSRARGDRQGGCRRRGAGVCGPGPGR
eukprot:14151465-Alexandrium_andersonii.AAC.1